VPDDADLAQPRPRTFTAAELAAAGIGPHRRQPGAALQVYGVWYEIVELDPDTGHVSAVLIGA